LYSPTYHFLLNETKTTEFGCPSLLCLSSNEDGTLVQEKEEKPGEVNWSRTNSGMKGLHWSSCRLCGALGDNMTRLIAIIAINYEQYDQIVYNNY